ncbi:MAG: sigma-70 family RNA polymerase sigma factor [Planctomycetes bacterium]|nr:sigma-70 family RNA polymerase sigma factor [Planctomycetota bacterium]
MNPHEPLATRMVAMGPIERDFDVFRTRHDPAALGSVFDAVAPELLLVAAHFAGPGVEAEDLVQATFVDAIEKAARWDATRPLVPWLIGILVNHARAARRRARKAIDVDRAAHDVVVDPLEELQASEVAGRVGEALRSLPRQFRQALTLRLVHGLTPTQIAHAIGCPVATVKTRLQRGMDQLRRALPAGIAGSLALVLSSQKSLAAVRVAVLAHAKALVPAAAAAAAGIAVAVASTGLVMKKLVAAAVAVVIGVALWTSLDSPSAGERPAPDHPDAAAQRVAELARDTSSSATPSSDAIPGARAAIATEPPATTGSAILTCVWKHDGTPARALRLSMPGTSDGPGDTRSSPWRQLRSDDAGRVELRDLDPGEYIVSGRSRSTSLRIVAGECVEQRIEFEAALRIDGRVVDASGAAVADAEVWLQYFPDPQDDRPRKVASSRADGTFRCAFDFGGSLWARKAAHASSACVDVEQEGHAEVVLELGALVASLRGSVRKADGSPAARAHRLRARRPRGRAACAARVVVRRTGHLRHGRTRARRVAHGGAGRRPRADDASRHPRSRRRDRAASRTRCHAVR